MNVKPRDRVIKAINHIKPDRTPCDFWARPEVWRMMKKHYQIETNDDLLDILGMDLRKINIEECWPEYGKKTTGFLKGDTELSGKS